MSTTNAQFVFEDQYPFLDLTRGQGREFENDTTQRCFNVHQKAFYEDHSNRQRLENELAVAKNQGDAVLRIAMNVRRALIEKLEADIVDLRNKVRRLEGSIPQGPNYADLQHEVDSKHPRLSVVLRLGQTHANYGWAPNPAPMWDKLQRIAYLEGYAAVKERQDWASMVEATEDKYYAFFCNQLHEPIDKP